MKKITFVIATVSVIGFLLLGFYIGKKAGFKDGYNIGTINGWTQCADYQIIVGEKGLAPKVLDLEKAKKLNAERKEKYQLIELNEKMLDMSIVGPVIEGAQ